MSASLDEDEETNIYHDLISDHTDIIVTEIDIDRAIKDYPYKNAISKTEFRKLISETDNQKKGKCLIRHLLKRKRLKELKALFEIVTGATSQHYLLTVLNDRITRCKASAKVDSEYANEDQDSDSDSSLNSTIRTIESLQDEPCDWTLNGDKGFEGRDENGQRENGNGLRSRDDETQQEGELICAKKLIREKTEENTFLIEEQRKLKEEKQKIQKELEEAKTKLDKMQREISSIEDSNSHFKTQLITAKGDIRTLRGKLDSRTEEISDMKSEIKDLRGNMESFDKELRELDSLKQTLSKTKKSKMCSLM